MPSHVICPYIGSSILIWATSPSSASNSTKIPNPCLICISTWHQSMTSPCTSCTSCTCTSRPRVHLADLRSSRRSPQPLDARTRWVDRQLLMVRFAWHDWNGSRLRRRSRWTRHFANIKWFKPLTSSLSMSPSRQGNTTSSANLYQPPIEDESTGQEAEMRVIMSRVYHRSF